MPQLFWQLSSEERADCTHGSFKTKLLSLKLHAPSGLSQFPPADVVCLLLKGPKAVGIFIPSPEGICSLDQLVESEQHQCLCRAKQRGHMAGDGAGK